MASLRDRQIAALKQMLNLNQPETKTVAPEPVWKILIYDRFGQDIISPLLSVKELREMGVTLHVQLHSEREPVPDVPAVYFCLPSEENLGRISQDFHSQLYDVYHLNFISPLARQKLEDLAAAALQANCVANVHKVYDQYLNFISLEDDLFILRNQNVDTMSYYAINRGGMKDSEMDTIIDTIVDSLFSVFATLGVVPIIRCGRGNAAELVAEKLDKKMRESLRDTRSTLFLSDSSQVATFSFQRPLLIVLDRNVDLATPLHHTWTYQALAHDVLDLCLNKVSLGAGQGKVCHLDPKDPFWAQHKGSPFPTVAEAIQEELEQYRSSEEEVKKLKASMGIDGDSDAAFAVMTDNTARLTSAVNSLPQLIEKKRLIDMHTNIATVMLEGIKARRLDTLFEFEERLLGGAALDRPLMELLDSDTSGPTLDDKIRLFLIYYICSQHIPDAELDKYMECLEKAGCDMTPLKYIERCKAYARMVASPSQYTGGGTKTVSMFSKLVSKGSSFVMEGVKNLVVKKHNLPVTRLVDQVVEGRGGASEEYRWLDPRQVRPAGEVRPRPTAPSDAIVFVIGGGNYIEYHNLLDYAKSKCGAAGGTSRKIIYGATCLTNAKQFLKQLSLLGAEIQ